VLEPRIQFAENAKKCALPYIDSAPAFPEIVGPSCRNYYRFLKSFPQIQLVVAAAALRVSHPGKFFSE
jgi:hypothetical protein